MVEVVVFATAATACLVGALGVVLSRNPVHAALMLVMTLFGVAVLFVAREAHFLAAVQVIVYAGAIVVLFLFVIMLLGVDRAAQLSLGALPQQRWTAAAFGLVGLTVVAWLVTAVDKLYNGAPRSASELVAGATESGYGVDVGGIARSLFSDYVYAFELTSLLLIVAVIGTVILARRSEPSGEHSGTGPSGEHSGTGPSGEHSGTGPSGEHSGTGPSGEHSGTGPSGEHSGTGSSAEFAASDGAAP